MQPDLQTPKDPDSEALLDHVALECMNALEGKDMAGFRDGIKVLIAHTLNEMTGAGPESEENESC